MSNEQLNSASDLELFNEFINRTCSIKEAADLINRPEMKTREMCRDTHELQGFQDPDTKNWRVSRSDIKRYLNDEVAKQTAERELQKERKDLEAKLKALNAKKRQTVTTKQQARTMKYALSEYVKRYVVQ